MSITYMYSTKCSTLYNVYTVLYVLLNCRLREHQLRLESLHSEQDQLISRCDEDKKLLPRLDALDQLVAEYALTASILYIF